MERLGERRLHERIAAGVQVFYEPERLTRLEREYLTGLGTSASLGGIFVATLYPLRPGTVLVVRLYLDADDAPPLRARAIVRWRRRLRHPRGMGIELLEFEHLGAERWAAWMPADGAAEPPAVPPPLLSGAARAGGEAAPSGQP